MKIIYGIVFFSCLIALAIGARHRHPLQQQILLEIEKRGTVAERVNQEMEMFTLESPNTSTTPTIPLLP